MQITVYSKPNCPQCAATKRAFDRMGLEYGIIDITQDAHALAQLQEAGFKQAPVVVAGEDWWSGYRPDKIRQLAAEPAQAGAGLR